MILIETTYGPISIELDEENTPTTAKNFTSYVQDGFYDGTIFHRVIDGFMIQGGGFEPDMTQKDVNSAIENEADKAASNAKGTIAMARTSDPHSATAQFFINLSDNTFLDHKAKTQDDWGYCVFGRVVDGMDVMKKIKSVETGSRSGHNDVPVEDIVIEKITITDA
jgi:peptidyl-prolyl cis-trans isomerase B (cyclophilin B)